VDTSGIAQKHAAHGGRCVWIDPDYVRNSTVDHIDQTAKLDN
jgi:hypothetical protein